MHPEYQALGAKTLTKSFSLAYGEMRLIMARILYNFDLEKADDLHWEDQTMFIVWQKGPLNVRLTPVAARAAAGEER
jgi:hypothetical protein